MPPSKSKPSSTRSRVTIEDGGRVPEQSVKAISSARRVSVGEREEPDDESTSAATPKKSGKDPFKGGPFGFGNPDQYPEEAVLQPADIVEFHARRRGKKRGVAYVRDLFSRMLKREQTTTLQQMLVFDQAIGKLLEYTATLPYEDEYQVLLERIVEQTRALLQVKKVRLFGVDYNSLSQPRELWVVAGTNDTGNLGRSIKLSEWAGLALEDPTRPVIADDPRNHDRYGTGYADLAAADKKFKMSSLCATAIRMRDFLHFDGSAFAGMPVAKGSRSSVMLPRYVLEVYNRDKATTLMNCDRATLFLVEEDLATGEQQLWSQVAAGMPPVSLPLKPNSIAGAAVLTGEPIDVPDAYRDGRFDPQFDKTANYRTRSILCLPILNPVASECIGCLQLINKKDRFGRASEGTRFHDKDFEIGRNFCSVVAIAALKSERQAEAEHQSQELAERIRMAG